MKNFFLRNISFFVLVGLWMIFANPYFFQGKVPYASSYQVNFFPPWSSYEDLLGPVKNNAMPDIHAQIYPWKKFTIDTYRGGEIPLWNPYSFAGNPHLANFQSAVFSPFNLLFFILPFIDAWSILVLLQPLLAGLFTYRFMRSLKVSGVGSLIASVSFMFSGFMVVWMAYGTLAYAILYLPLSLFAIEKYFTTGNLRFLLLLILIIPLSFFSGHFQISLYFLFGVISFVVFQWFATRNIRRTFYIILSVCVGIFLSVPQIFPSISLYLYSVRSGLFQVGEVIPFQYLITIISPDFFGNPVTRNDWFGHYAEWAGFIGIWPLILAIYSMVRLRLNIAAFFSIVGITSIVLAAQTPLSSFIVSLKIPVLSTSSLSRIIVLFSFSFAVLAGLGFDKLRKDLEYGYARKTTVLILAAVAVFFVFTWILLFIGKIYPDEWLIVAKRNLVLPTVFFSAGAFLLIIPIRKKILISFTIFCLLFAVLFDSLRFAQKWMPFDPREYVFPEVSVIDAIKKNIGFGRIFGNIGGEVTTYYKVPSIEGYDPLYIGRYGEFIRSAHTGEFLDAERSLVKLGRRGKYTNRVLDILGVSLIFHPVADTNQGWAFPVWEDKNRFSLIYQEKKFQLFRNNFAFPRAALFYDYELISDKKEIIRRFYNENFDFRKKIILEEKANISMQGGNGKAEIVTYSANKIVIRAQTTAPALLFIADNYYPGWSARVNGKETKIYRANYTFRAALIPKGESTVEFEYSLL